MAPEFFKINEEDTYNEISLNNDVYSVGLIIITLLLCTIPRKTNNIYTSNALLLDNADFMEIYRMHEKCLYSHDNILWNIQNDTVGVFTRTYNCRYWCR